MGRWVDFQNSYKTMDTSYQESVWWGLKQFWDKGLIYEDRKVLLYCSRCETPISNFEVAMDNSYQDVTENSVFVKFKLTPKQRILDWISDEQTYVLAWTTTPWTLPGNTALNVGPEIAYVLVESSLLQAGVKEKYILAKDRLEVLEGEYEILLEFSARSLEGLSYEPLYQSIAGATSQVLSGDVNRAHKIYIEDFVTTEDGTGVVHNAAMYGEEDYVAAKRRDLPRVDLLDQKGEFNSLAPEFLRGRFFKDADKLVLQELETRGLTYKVLPFTHSYPHCYRCATPLFYNALPAWFVNIQKIKPTLLEKNQDVNWFPGHLKHGRFYKSVEGAPDWNISRNRYWATALPFWKCQSEECQAVVCIGSVQELVEKSINFVEVYPHYQAEFSLGKEALEKLDLHRPYIDEVVLKCEKCSGTMKRVSEVVDCWVESGSMPFAELHAPFENQALFEQRFPADFVAEYIAQTRAWFYVMHVVGVSVFDKAPFRNVVTTGTILAEDGAKMSKSLGNFPDPWLLVQRYGMDAIRFYLMSTPVMQGDDLNFSEKGVKEINQKVNMLLYNVFSFYNMNVGKLAGEKPDFFLEPKSKHVLDVWIFERTKQLTLDVTAALDNYSTPKACRAIVDFISDLSTWYVRRSRERMKSSDGNGSSEGGGNIAVEVLGFVLVRLARLLAPVAPFLSEKIFRQLTGLESVHLTKWPMLSGDSTGTNFSAVVDDRILEQMQLVRDICSMALALRKQQNISVRQPLAAIAYKLKTDIPLSLEHLAIVLDELNIKAVKDFDSLEEQKQLKGGVAVLEGQGLVSQVAIDIVLTEELKQEGFTRELERAVQDLRKKAGLKVGEQVVLYYNTQDAILEEQLLRALDRQKTSVKEVLKEAEVEAEEEAQTEIGGNPIWLGIIKAK
jgi:isoleucyl-tRNA synthetase